MNINWTLFGTNENLPEFQFWKTTISFSQYWYNILSVFKAYLPHLDCYSWNKYRTYKWRWYERPISRIPRAVCNLDYHLRIIYSFSTGCPREIFYGIISRRIWNTDHSIHEYNEVRGSLTHRTTGARLLDSTCWRHNMETVSASLAFERGPTLWQFLFTGMNYFKETIGRPGIWDALALIWRYNNAI